MKGNSNSMPIKNIYQKYLEKYRTSKEFRIIIITCASVFIFGFLLGYIFTEAEKTEMIEAIQKEQENIGQTKNIPNIADEVIPSIVLVRNRVKIKDGENVEMKDKGIGSGIIYKDDGYIITNQHVVNKASEVIVTLSDGSEYKGEIVGEDKRSDLAVIKIPGSAFRDVKIGDSDRLKVGERVIAIGNPVGEVFNSTVTDGIISGLNRTIMMNNRRMTLIQTSAAINPGNSGGALVNEKGEVIGINSAKLTGEEIEGMGFAIPINDALPIIDELIEYGYIKRPWLGLGLGETTDELVERYKIPKGIYIGKIDEIGPGSKSGLIEGDIILEIDNKRVESLSVMSSVIDKYNPGDEIKIKVFRRGNYKYINLVLEEAPPNR
ncbi:serine protease Do-like HtrA [Gottschalkia purinilytica]|uniref:Serine protease Do-like HtrA n=1 Tax=Gottschalkia purinilytica TaxID=1503 RepID=A0A0L0W8Q1_GOTPU|nr:trypsin-like peptidase domain-containing protein [Gottschalkia purinilytica]KNF07938.1 serine protease Do-like HtrA [Gottschalkia purinilytica]